jgi:hypothetical protein
MFGILLIRQSYICIDVVVVDMNHVVVGAFDDIDMIDHATLNHATLILINASLLLHLYIIKNLFTYGDLPKLVPFSALRMNKGITRNRLQKIHVRVAVLVVHCPTTVP